MKGEGRGLEFQMCILKNVFFKNHLESFPGAIPNFATEQKPKGTFYIFVEILKMKFDQDLFLNL